MDGNRAARPVVRLLIAGGLWCFLALFVLLLAVSTSTFSVGVLGGFAWRAALGGLAIWKALDLKKSGSARLGFVRFVYLLVPPLVFGLFIVEMRLASASDNRSPLVTVPEDRLGDALRRLPSEKRLMKDGDTPSMIFFGGLGLQLGLGIAIAAAMKKT